MLSTELRCPRCGSTKGPGCNCRGDKYNNLITHDGAVRTNINFGLNARTVGYDEYKIQYDKLEGKKFEPFSKRKDTLLDLNKKDLFKDDFLNTKKKNLFDDF